MTTMRIEEKLKKGNGSMIYGVSIMMITLAFFIMFVQIFLIDQNSYTVQAATDSMADGTAFYLSTRNLEEDHRSDYQAGVDTANDIKDLVNEYTGTNVDITNVNHKTLDDNIFTVSANDSAPSISIMSNSISYVVEKTAGTEWGYGRDYVKLAVAAAYNPNIRYGQSNAAFPIPRTTWWLKTGADPKTTIFSGADCSSFVHTVLWKTKNINVSPEPWPLTTWTLPAALLSSGWQCLGPATSLSMLRPGDVLNMDDQHVKIYIGNGQCVEMTPPWVEINPANYYGYTVYRKR